MKLAVNYSESLLLLLRQNPHLQVDYIKVPTIPFPGCFTQFESGAKLRPLLPHTAQPGVMALGHPDPQMRYDSELMGQVIRQTQPPYLSTHLEARVEYFPELQAYQHEGGGKWVAGLLKRFLDSIAEVKKSVKLPIIVENFPYYRWLHHFRAVSEPEFITEVCQQGECGFLLDIAHARCSACSMERNIESYLEALPLDRLREIHLTGVQAKKDGIRDTHTALDETDYRLLHQVLQWARPEVITLEYGGMPDQIQNRNGEFEPISRNNPEELQMMICRLRQIIADFKPELSQE